MLDEPLNGLDPAVEIRDLGIGHSTVSLAFRYSASGSTGFSLLEQQGDVRVTMSA